MTPYKICLGAQDYLQEDAFALENNKKRRKYLANVHSYPNVVPSDAWKIQTVENKSVEILQKEGARNALKTSA